MQIEFDRDIAAAPSLAARAFPRKVAVRRDSLGSVTKRLVQTCRAACLQQFLGMR